MITITLEEWLSLLENMVDGLPDNHTLEDAISNAYNALRFEHGRYCDLDIPSIPKQDAENFYAWLDDIGVEYDGNEL